MKTICNFHTQIQKKGFQNWQEIFKTEVTGKYTSMIFRGQNKDHSQSKAKNTDRNRYLMLFKDNQKKTTAMPSNTSPEAFNSAETSGQREGSWGADL